MWRRKDKSQGRPWPIYCPWQDFACSPCLTAHSTNNYGVQIFTQKLHSCVLILTPASLGLWSALCLGFSLLVCPSLHGIPPVSSLLASSASPGFQWRLPIAFSLPLCPAGSAEISLCSARCRSELLSGGLCQMADFWD